MHGLTPKSIILGNAEMLLNGNEMRRAKIPKTGKFAMFKSMVLFNFAALIAFLLGTAAFELSMFAFPNPTFAWLFANALGGVSHFGANFVLQKQTTKGIAKNFIVFNATGIIGFLIASAMFAVAIIFIQNSTAAWFVGSLFGTMTHFILNDKAMKLDIKALRERYQL